jgi:hypothetical protein
MGRAPVPGARAHRVAADLAGWTAKPGESLTAAFKGWPGSTLRPLRRRTARPATLALTTATPRTRSQTLSLSRNPSRVACRERWAGQFRFRPTRTRSRRQQTVRSAGDKPEVRSARGRPVSLDHCDKVLDGGPRARAAPRDGRRAGCGSVDLTRRLRGVWKGAPGGVSLLPGCISVPQIRWAARKAGEFQLPPEGVILS